jgi:hypothetical protein
MPRRRRAGSRARPASQGDASGQPRARAAGGAARAPAARVEAAVDLAEAAVNLGGGWQADDGGLYYLRHLADGTLWWAGLHNDGYHKGIAFANVFRGHVDLNARTIMGEWAEIPRCRGPLHDGQLALEIVTSALDVAQARGQGGNHEPPGHLPPPQLVGLRQIRAQTTGGFGGMNWTGFGAARLDPQDTGDIYVRQRRGTGTLPLGYEIHCYRDFTVALGSVGGGRAYAWDPAQPRDYCEFMASSGDRNPENKNPDGDGDITFDVVFSPDDRRALDGQPGFWTDAGWVLSRPQVPIPGPLPPRSQSPADILSMLNERNGFHCELVMFGREQSIDDCRNSAGGLLPGWAETGGNSVLVNGLPVGGNAFVGADGVSYFVLFTPEVSGEQLPMPIKPGGRVRVTGCIAVDTGHFNQPDNLELHPVYAVDFIQDFQHRARNANLTGVWHCDDVGTYYLRQLGANTVWWFGLSRDQGRSFANVFRGALNGEIIQGDWAEIPVAVEQIGSRPLSSGTLTLRGNDGRRSTSLSKIGETAIFGGSSWQKLYDRPYFVVSPTTSGGGVVST